MPVILAQGAFFSCLSLHTNRDGIRTSPFLLSWALIKKNTQVRWEGRWVPGREGGVSNPQPLSRQRCERIWYYHRCI